MGLRLQELREEKKLSQEAIAKELQVTRQAYSRYEHGERELGYTALMKLANFFDVSIDYLLGNSIYFYPDSMKESETNLPSEEAELLVLFGEMTSAQRARFLAYGEGLLGKVPTKNKA